MQHAPYSRSATRTYSLVLSPARWAQTRSSWVQSSAPSKLRRRTPQLSPIPARVSSKASNPAQVQGLANSRSAALPIRAEPYILRRQIRKNCPPQFQQVDGSHLLVKHLAIG